MHSKHSGFTLLELVATVAVAALLAAFAVPGFAGLIRDQRLTTQANDLLSGLWLARSEAVKRARRVTLCGRDAAAAAPACAAAGFSAGWIVFADSNANGVLDGSEAVIRHVAFEPQAGVEVSGNRPVARYVSYVSTGRTEMTSGAFQAGTITLCSAGRARRIVISSSGRPRVERNGTCE